MEVSEHIRFVYHSGLLNYELLLKATVDQTRLSETLYLFVNKPVLSQ